MIFSEKDPEVITQDQQKLIDELEIKLSQLRRMTDELYDIMGVTPKELNALCSSSIHFSPTEWAEVVRIKNKIDALFSNDVLFTARSSDTKIARAQLSELKRDWIFVR